MPPKKIDVLSTVRKYNRDAFFGVAHKIGHLKNELNGSQNTKYFTVSDEEPGSNTTSSIPQLDVEIYFVATITNAKSDFGFVHKRLQNDI